MKKPLSTQLLEAQNEIALLKAQLDTATKTTTSAESMRKHYSENADRATNLVSELHELLDMIPYAPPREREARDNEYGKQALSPAARLIGYVARRPA